MIRIAQSQAQAGQLWRKKAKRKWADTGNRIKSGKKNPSKIITKWKNDCSFNFICFTNLKIFALFVFIYQFSSPMLTCQKYKYFFCKQNERNIAHKRYRIKVAGSFLGMEIIYWPLMPRSQSIHSTIVWIFHSPPRRVQVHNHGGQSTRYQVDIFSFEILSCIVHTDCEHSLVDGGKSHFWKIPQ